MKTITHLGLASYEMDIGKHCRPGKHGRPGSDAAIRGVWSVSTMFVIS